MLLEFTVGNYLSFKEPVTLSLEAASITDFPDNIFRQGKHMLLKSVAIYGANASGKSNLVQAISTMRHVIKASAKMASTDIFDVTPFLLNTASATDPCLFEILFLADGFRYRYGFEITADKVHAEWLYQAKVTAEKPLFLREDDSIEVTAKFAEGKGLEEKTRDNALFLAVCDQFNGAIAGQLMRWFDNCNTISGLTHENYRGVTFKMLNDESCRPAMLEFLEKLDFGFDEVQVAEEEFSADALPDDMPLATRLRLASNLKGHKLLRFKSVHDIYDAADKKAGRREFDVESQESSGTNKVFDLLGPFFDTLINGRVLVVDELDAKLHPLLTKALVSLFNSADTNPLNAQLLFATHDTNLLTYGGFRRDQIYFVEKDRQGATSLYSLIEYKEDGETIRKDRSFEKDYVRGRYGAIPYLGDFSKLFKEWREKEKSLTT